MGWLCGSGRDTPGIGQAVVEVVQTRVGACQQTFSNPDSRIREGAHLRLDDVIQPAFRVSNIDYGMGAVVHDRLLLHAESQCPVHNACATLGSEQLDGAERSLCTECVAACNATPQ